MLSCRLTFGPLWLRIFLFHWWFLLALFGLFVLHWRYELPCQDKLPEFHYTSIVGCIRVSWLVLHPLGLELDKALFGWNSVNTHPSGDGEPPWSNDPDERSAFDPNFDEFGDYTQRAIQTLSILDDSSSTLTPCPTLMTNQHVFRTYQHDVSHEVPDYEKFRPYFGWVNVDTVQKAMEQSTQSRVSLPNTFPMKKHLKSRTLHLTFLGGMKLLPLILYSQTLLQ